MSKTIKIISKVGNSGIYFDYEINDFDFEYFIKHTFSTCRCVKCGAILHPIYFYIIKKFKKAGLLDKKYPPLCCICFSKKEREEIAKRNS